MTIEQLRTFQAVARHQSFSDAARALHVTQPSVSARIKGLEADLGARLFRRRGTRVELTPAGSRYLEFVERAIHLLDEGQGRITAGACEAATLRVGAPSSLVQFVLPKAIQEFSGQWPEVRLQVLTGTTEVLLESLRMSGVDLIFARYRPATPDCRRVAEFCEPLLVVASPDHPVACGADPAAFPFVLLDRQRGYWSLQTTLPDDPMHPVETTAFEVDNVTTAKSLVLEGRAVGLLPASSLGHEIESGALVRLCLPGLTGLQRLVVAVANPDIEPMHLAKGFADAVGRTIDSLAQAVAGRQPWAPSTGLSGAWEPGPVGVPALSGRSRAAGAGRQA